MKQSIFITLVLIVSIAIGFHNLGIDVAGLSEIGRTTGRIIDRFVSNAFIFYHRKDFDFKKSPG